MTDHETDACHPLVVELRRTLKDADLLAKFDYIIAENRVYVLFFVHLRTRRVHVANVTANPRSDWARQQARNFLMHLDEIPERCEHVIHDRDASLLPLDHVLGSAGVKVVKTPRQSPWCNGFAERVVREARETLDNLVIVGERNLHRTMKAVERHHNRERPHQGSSNLVPVGFDYPDKPVPADDVERVQELGGLLAHYRRKAA